MFMLRCLYTAKTGAAAADVSLFIHRENARAAMMADFEKEKALASKYGDPFPEETSQENEESYTDISDDEIHVRREDDVQRWEVVEIIPQDIPASLADPAEEGAVEARLVYARVADQNGVVSAYVLGDPVLNLDEEETPADLAKSLEVDPSDENFDWDFTNISLPTTMVNRIQTDGIRKFLAGEFKIEPVGYAIADCMGIGDEIEMISDDGVFESDEEAVQQAIKDGVKLIPVEELPENFDRRYLGWIDTPENRQKILSYCDRCKKAMDEKVRDSIKTYLIFEDTTSEKYPFKKRLSSITDTEMDRIVSACKGEDDTETIHDAIEGIIGLAESF